MKTLRVIKLLISFCIILLIFIYCLNLYHPSNSFTPDHRFTFVSPLTLWSNIATGIAEGDEDFHTQTKLMGSETLDMNKQIETINNVILTKPDGIITAASEESKDLREAIQSAVSQDIPVVLVDSDLPNTNRSCYIGTDNYSAGEMAGADMYSATGEKANIGIVVSDLDYPNQLERVEGFIQQISQYDNMKVITILECHSQRLELLEKVPEMLEDNPQIDALFLAEAIASVVIGDVVQTSFPSRDLTIVAFDSTEETLDFVESGTYYSTITQDPVMQGYLAVQTLCQIIDGQPVNDVIHTPTYSIKSDNVETQHALINEDIAWYLY